jgi:hypothetical protein
MIWVLPCHLAGVWANYGGAIFRAGFVVSEPVAKVRPVIREMEREPLCTFIAPQSELSDIVKCPSMEVVIRIQYLDGFSTSPRGVYRRKGHEGEIDYGTLHI